MQSTGENLDIHITGPLLSGIETLPSTSETDTTPYELKKHARMEMHLHNTDSLFTSNQG